MILSIIREEWNRFCSSWIFATRLPVPPFYAYSESTASTRYFPLIGWIVSIVTSFSTYFLSWILPVEISVVFGMILSVLSTGGLHEDGFADVCDAFGGGWNKEKILEIMKDSRIGTFGALGLILTLIFKYLLLVKLFQMSPRIFLFTSWFAHGASRWLALVLMVSLPYAGNDGLSKSKSMVKNYPLSTLFFRRFSDVFRQFVSHLDIKIRLRTFFLVSFFRSHSFFIFEITLRNGSGVLRGIVSGSHNKEPNFSFTWE